MTKYDKLIFEVIFFYANGVIWPCLLSRLKKIKKVDFFENEMYIMCI